MLIGNQTSASVDDRMVSESTVRTQKVGRGSCEWSHGERSDLTNMCANGLLAAPVVVAALRPH
jgi:hypothetical protein